MAAKTLSRDDLAFGRAVLLATDSLGMSAEGAFWLYDNRDDEWRFFLVTSLFNRVGPREIYLRLNKGLAKKLSAQETQSFTFYLADPGEKFVREIRKHVKTTAHTSEPTSVTFGLNGHQEKAYVYRMTAGLRDKEAKLVQRRFRRLSNELAIA